MGDLASSVEWSDKRRTDSVSIGTQEFVSHNKNRKRSFGTLVGGLFNILPILDSI